MPPSPCPFPPWGKGRPRLFHARGCAPCIPGAEPVRHRLTCKQPIPFPFAPNRRLPPPGCRGRSPRRKPKGVLPPSPAPSPPGKGRPRLFHARGFAPCIPGAEPERHGLTCKQPIPPLLRRTVGSRRRGAGGGAPGKNRRVFCPHPPAPSPRGKGRPRVFHARGFAPCIPGAEPERHGLTCKQPIPPLLHRTVGSRLRGAGGGAPGEKNL